MPINNTPQQAIIGAGTRRRALDYYPTPNDVTKAFLDCMRLSKKTVFWEPACGSGNIVDVLRERGYRAIGTDIVTGDDFLMTDPPNGVDFIITNPPFILAEDFIKRAWSMDLPFAFLLKSQFWHAAKRLNLFNEITPSLVLPLTWRPDFTGGGKSLMDVMWCVWGVGLQSDPLYIPLRRPRKEDENV